MVLPFQGLTDLGFVKRVAKKTPKRNEDQSP